jgi:acyl-CoA thioester hydrolase
LVAVATTEGREESGRVPVSSAPWHASRAAHVYLAHFRVRFSEVDPLGHVNNAIYLTYLEQAAIDHAAAAGFDVERLRALGGVFIARRHEIDYLRPAVDGDWLRVTTWPVDLHGARAERAYEIARLTTADLGGGWPVDGLHATAAAPRAGGEVLVRARTEWAYVDASSGRPRRIPAELIAAFLVSSGE